MTERYRDRHTQRQREREKEREPDRTCMQQSKLKKRENKEKAI